MRTIPDREQRALLFALAVFAMGSIVLLFSKNYLSRVPLAAQAMSLQDRGAAAESNASHSRKQRLNPNYATERELLSLPGIGPSIARRILLHRRDNIFFSTDDLLAIKGIGEETLKGLASHLEFESARPTGEGE